MKQMLTMLLLLMLAPTAMRAEGDVQRLVVWLTDGQKVRFDLTEEPETTFEDGKLVIQTSQTTVMYQLSGVLRYTYEGEMPSVGVGAVRPGEVVFRQGRDQMQFDGLADGTRLEVYSMDGKRLATQTARSGQTTTVSLAGHPAGTYVVRVGDTSYKFIKR